jgi:transposase
MEGSGTGTMTISEIAKRLEIGVVTVYTAIKAD